MGVEFLVVLIKNLQVLSLGLEGNGEKENDTKTILHGIKSRLSSFNATNFAMKRLLILILVLFSLFSCNKKCGEFEMPKDGDCIEYRSLYYGQFTGTRYVIYPCDTSSSCVPTTLSLYFGESIPILNRMKMNMDGEVEIFLQSSGLANQSFNIPRQTLKGSEGQVIIQGLGHFINLSEVQITFELTKNNQDTMFWFQGFKQ